MGKRKQREAANEPTPEGDDWVECGGHLICAAGFTEWGFPYGLSEGEFREASARDNPAAGWSRAKRILGCVVLQWAGPGAKVDVGYVKRMGGGLSRDVFAAEVEVAKDFKRDVHEVAVLLPRHRRYESDVPDLDLTNRTRKEARLLHDLASVDWPFRVPRIFGVYPDGESIALVRSFERGMALELRAGKQSQVRPWEVVGNVAASIHWIMPEKVPWLEPRYATRLDHAQAAMRELDDLAESEATDARAWMQEHLPPPTPSTLVHGDLLGQNILLGLGEPDAVIGWEYAEFGDPAYDLAIVTRGVRRPFQIDRGMDRLLEAYALAGGSELARSAVHFHELALAARWYREALNGDGPNSPAQALRFFGGLLRRASAG
jgi:aminoglycoside phosphotransferase (APT) family kinase protein